MRVVIVNQYALPSGSSGITRHGDLAAELVKMGHRTEIIASDFNYLSRRSARSQVDCQQDDGVRFHWLRTRTYKQNDAHRVRSMVEFMLRSILIGMRLERRPDVVIGSSPQLLAGLSAWAIARRYRVPFVFEIRDPWPSALVDLGAITRRGLANRLLERVERFVYHSADRIITVMAHVDRRVAEVGEDLGKCVHIPNAVALPATLPSLPSSLETIFTNAAQSDRRIIVYAGAHGVSNGLHDVVAALTELRNVDPASYERLAVVFIGDGPEKQRVRDQVRTERHAQVHFHDPVPKAAMLAAMRSADWVLVHFAKAEFKRYGMSANKLFDAMAVARPVLLATPLLDTPVDTVGCGLRYSPGSPRELAEVLRAAAQMSDSDRLAMGKRGEAEARQSYSIDVTAKQLEKLLVDVMSIPSHGRFDG